MYNGVIMLSVSAFFGVSLVIDIVIIVAEVDICYIWHLKGP